MAIVVVGGQARKVGKTSVAAGLIAATPERNWVAVKISRHEHVALADASPCWKADGWVLTEERDRSGNTDTSRFLAAGARRSFWLRVAEDQLAKAAAVLQHRIVDAGNVLIESDSIMRVFRPDLYLVVLDSSLPDFKQSCQEFLDRASALILHDSAGTPDGKHLPCGRLMDKPIFRIKPPHYVTEQLLEFMQAKLEFSGTKR
jgi:hypothetical protein